MDDTMKQNKKVTLNIMKVVISNLIILLAGVVNGFIVPKVMHVADYGVYKIFSLYATYISLLHIGFIDGVYIIFAGKSYEELNKPLFRLFSKFLFGLELGIAVIVSITAFFLPGEYKWIFLILASNLIFVNVGLYFQYISQVTERFTELSVRNIIKSILSILVAVVLFILYNLFEYYTNAYLFIATVVIINFLLALWYCYTYRDLIFGEALKFRDEKDQIIKVFKEGVPYTLASFLASFVLTIDRQFVSILYENEVYAVYAFAYNMLALITTATSAISTVLYPHLKKSGDDALKSMPRIRNIVSVVTGIMMLAYFVLIYIVTYFLPKYTDSIYIFYIILPGLMFSSVISVVLVNFFKILGKQKIYLFISLGTVALAFALNMGAYYIFGTTSSISWASTITMVVWYLVSNGYFFIKYKIPFWKNLVFVSIVGAGFYVTAHFFNDWIGFLIYGFFVTGFSILVNYKELKFLLDSRKNKKQEKIENVEVNEEESE